MKQLHFLPTTAEHLGRWAAPALVSTLSLRDSHTQDGIFPTGLPARNNVNSKAFSKHIFELPAIVHHTPGAGHFRDDCNASGTISPVYPFPWWSLRWTHRLPVFITTSLPFLLNPVCAGPSLQTFCLPFASKLWFSGNKMGFLIQADWPLAGRRPLVKHIRKQTWTAEPCLERWDASPAGKEILASKAI